MRTKKLFCISAIAFISFALFFGLNGCSDFITGKNSSIDVAITLPDQNKNESRNITSSTEDNYIVYGYLYDSKEQNLQTQIKMGVSSQIVYLHFDNIEENSEVYVKIDIKKDTTPPPSIYGKK